MAFAISGTTITQSGTDTSCAGLSSIAGVTTTTLPSGQKIYQLNARLQVTGTLSMNADAERIEWLFTAPTFELFVTTGTFTITGASPYRRALALRFIRQSGSTFDQNQSNIRVSGTGRLSCTNVELMLRSPFHLEAGSQFTFNNASLISDRTDGSSPFVRSWSTAGFNATGFTLMGWTVALFRTPATFQAPSLVSSSLAPEGERNGGSDSNFIVRDFRSLLSSSVSSSWGAVFALYNAEQGHLSTLGIPTFIRTNHVGSGGGTVWSEYTLAALDSSTGSGVAQWGFYELDWNSGQRTTLVSGSGLNSVDYTGDYGNFSANANPSTTNAALLFVGCFTPGGQKLDKRQQVDNTKELTLFAYGYQPSKQSVNLAGTGVKSLSYRLSTDAYVSLSAAAVAALTTASTVDNFYDLQAWWKWGTGSSKANIAYLGTTTQPAVANGTRLDLGARNLVVDATAAQVLAINTSTNTITLKANNLGPGTKLQSITTTGTVTTANGASITAAFIDAGGARLNVAGLDPSGLGTTWVLGYIKNSDYQARDTTKPPAQWTGWNASSGTGNSTQITLQANTVYQVFHLCPGYGSDGLPLASLDTGTQTSLTLKPAADTDLAGNLLWPQTSSYTTQGALFSYNSSAAAFEFANTTGAWININFLAAYWAFETLAKAPAIAYQWVQPLYLNGTKNGFLLPRANLFQARMTASSTSGATLVADMSYSDTQQAAFDRFVVNASNAGSFLLVMRATADLSGSAVASIRLGLALSSEVAAVQATANLVKTKTDALPASPAAVGSAMTLTTAYDSAKSAASQTSVSAIPTNPVLTTDARLSGLSNLDAAVSSRLASSAYVSPDNTSIGSIAAKLPSSGANIAGEGTTAKNLDQVAGGGGSTVNTATLAAEVKAAMEASGGKLDQALQAAKEAKRNTW